ncbi:MAG: winged helix-turn-helix domain-containing protein [Candidatus ainarchaeum sp.]|nr:winged helix-turn-helix domain-containing protein [Candidatus ainarchaeum sp.]
MDESIRLDRKSFEALAGQTRVRILKSLLKRRKTLTELSHELGLSASTTKEHLDVLVGSELAVQVDEGRKWKYYELTRKGRSVVQPHELRVWIVLGLSIIAAGAAIFNLFYALQAPQYAAQGFGAMETAAASGTDETGSLGIAPSADDAALGSADAQAPRAAAAPAEDGNGAENDVAMEGAGDVQLAAAEQAPVPFLEAGIAAAAILVFAWALLYARGEGAL